MAIKPKYVLSDSGNFPKSSRQFTDREEYIAAFKKLCERREIKDYSLLVFYGVGGVGKTTLRKELGKILESDYPQTIWTAIDLDVPTYRDQETALFVLRNAIHEKYKVHFPTFDVAYTAYWHKTHPQTQITKDNFPLLSGTNAVAGIVRVVGEMPWIGWIPKMTKAFMTGSNVFREWWVKRGEKELATLPEMEAKDIAQRLPMYWAVDLQDHLIQKNLPAVIFIDTYEALWENISAEGGFFLRDEWIRELVTNLPGVIFVVCGREKLRWDELEKDWEEFFEQHLIGGLSDIDSKRFLLTCEIKEEAIQDIIVQASRGLPHFLDLAVDTYYEIKNRYNRNPTEKDFARTQQEVLDRFLRYLDKTEIETLKVLSSSRVWNREIFSKLVIEFRTGYPISAITNLCRFSFIYDSNVSENWTMHELMRISLQSRQDKELLIIVHKFLFDYYNNFLKVIDIKNINDKQKFSLNEAFYHGKICLEPKDFYKWFIKISDIFQKAAEYRTIVKMFDEVINYLKNVYESDSPEIAILHSELGIILTEIGKYNPAKEHHNISLNIREKILNPLHPDIAISLNNLVLIYLIEGRYKEAEPLCERAVKICESEENTGTTNAAQTFNNMALLYAEQGKYEDAKNLYQKALDINEKILGANHRDIAISLNNLATVYSYLGKYHDAIILNKRSLEISEKALGAEHPDVAESLNNLAVLHDHLSNIDEAEALYKRALEIKQNTLGENHPSLAILYNNLASLYVNKKNYSEAEELYQKAIALLEKELGSEHPNIARFLIGLASVNRHQEKFDKAEELLNKSLSILEKVFGSDHPDVALVLKHLGSVYEAKNEIDKAIDYFLKSKTVNEKSLGGDNPKIADDFLRIGNLFFKQNQYQEAEQNLKSALMIYEKDMEENHLKIIETLNSLSEVYEKKGDEKAYKEINSLIIKMEGSSPG